MKSLQYLGVGIAVVVATLACDRISAEEIERITASDSILAENAAMKLRPSYQDCLNNWFIDERPRIQCAYDEYDFQDTRLNASYKRLMDSLEAAGKLALRAEERKWIRKRRRRCDFGIDPLPDYVVDAADCEVREAAMRATELERRLAK
jgi:uncharacterized protein YecT (DUF1311 family)